jgi:hypothetical protein
LASCKSEDPFVSKEIIDQIESRKNPLVTNMAFIYNNDVYYFRNLQKEPIQLTHTPTSLKTEIRISHKGHQIAYLSDKLSPIIIDTTGKVLATLSQFRNVTQLDWSEDDQTLYMLIDNEIKFYGPSLPIPAITFPDEASNAFPRVVAISISINNDLAYVYRTFSFYGGRVDKLLLKQKDKPEQAQLITRSNSEEINYLRYVPKTNDLMVGYHKFGSYRELEKVEVYPYLSLYPSLSFESTESYVDPVFRTDLQYMVSGYKLNNYSSFILAAKRYMQHGENDTYIDQYSSKTHPLFVNWK